MVKVQSLSEQPGSKPNPAMQVEVVPIARGIVAVAVEWVIGDQTAGFESPGATPRKH